MAEIPLDRDVTSGILADSLPNALPKWRGVKYVTRGESMTYQKAAKPIADACLPHVSIAPDPRNHH